MQSSSNSSYSYSTRRGLAAIAIAGLTASSVISAAPSANVTTGGETLGDITSGSVKCVVGNPNAYVPTETVDWVWTERMSKYVPGSENIIFDQLVTNKGSLNYCIRWDSKDRLSRALLRGNGQAQTDFPACIMDSGTAATVTPSDGWMVRRVLENIKSRYSF
ncbi:neutral zinc metallopeptidase [Phytophthora cinnamomi]|uniref:neutral zinc metallopeptidase n=1 Tax=Phytophthora cinnamomi TaxID=4785 RepID=UPI0035598301|nr:neutral zinc metallopeptidase [Phytophthora cinnamomi]